MYAMWWHYPLLLIASCILLAASRCFLEIISLISLSGCLEYVHCIFFYSRSFHPPPPQKKERSLPRSNFGAKSEWIISNVPITSEHLKISLWYNKVKESVFRVMDVSLRVNNIIDPLKNYYREPMIDYEMRSWYSIGSCRWNNTTHLRLRV